MKTFSKPLLYFIFVFIVLTLSFRLGLSSFLNHEQYKLVTIIAISYGILLFASGWIFGKAHGINSLKFDMGLGFHFAGFLSWSLVSLFWFYAGFNSPKESVDSVYTAMIIWGIFFLAHTVLFLYLKRDTIRGIHKTDIFD